MRRGSDTNLDKETLNCDGSEPATTELLITGTRSEHRAPDRKREPYLQTKTRQVIQKGKTY